MVKQTVKKKMSQVGIEGLLAILPPVILIFNLKREKGADFIKNRYPLGVFPHSS
jgi:hypothetical protein